MWKVDNEVNFFKYFCFISISFFLLILLFSVVWCFDASWPAHCWKWDYVLKELIWLSKNKSEQNVVCSFLCSSSIAALQSTSSAGGEWIKELIKVSLLHGAWKSVFPVRHAAWWVRGVFRVRVSLKRLKLCALQWCSENLFDFLTALCGSLIPVLYNYLRVFHKPTFSLFRFAVRASSNVQRISCL